MWCTAERRLVRHDSTCLFQKSIPAMPFMKSKCPLPTRSLTSLRGTVRSTNSALWLHHAHPFVAASEKSTCLMHRSRGFGHGVVVSKICYNAVLSVVLWDCCKVFEVGLPAFHLQMFAKCDALPKGDLLDMFVWDIHSCRSFLEFQALLPALLQVVHGKWPMYSFSSTAKSCCFEDLTKWRSCISSTLGLSRKFRIFLNLAWSSLLVCKAWSES